jgi:hypothetical protein
MECDDAFADLGAPSRAGNDNENESSHNLETKGDSVYVGVQRPGAELIDCDSG